MTEKTYFNIFHNAEKGEYFISHQGSGAKGSAEVGKSQAKNAILILKMELNGMVYKGIMNKTKPEVMKENPKSPNIWGNLEDTEGVKYLVAGWWTTTNKNGEKHKMPFYSCQMSRDEKTTSGNKAAHSEQESEARIPF